MSLTESLVTYLEEIKEAVESGEHPMTDWEMSFMTDQINRYKQYGADTRFSPKQWGVIDKIASKVLGIDKPSPEVE
jgi:hypothetical protein